MTATMKLTKTERALLEKAARKPHGTLYAMVWHSTSSRQGLHGTRAANALKSLVRKGLAADLDVHSNYSENSDGWGSTHASEFSAKITEAGRQAIA